MKIIFKGSSSKFNNEAVLPASKQSTVKTCPDACLRINLENAPGTRGVDDRCRGLCDGGIRRRLIASWVSDGDEFATVAERSVRLKRGRSEWKPILGACVAGREVRIEAISETSARQLVRHDIDHARIKYLHPNASSHI